MKDKTNAAILALLLGWSGAHKFYLGRTGAGVLYLVLTLSFFLAWIPALAGFIDFIVLALMDKDEFNRRYNGANMLPAPVVVNMLPPAGYGGYGVPPYGPHGQPYGSPYGSPYGAPGQPPAPRPERNVDQLKTELEKLNELRISGLLTEEEFAQQKARLLGTTT
ncbi:NINE protein [Paraliomyxa miuraensis]|uniref:NINE protein n=1 Tax=Paraliomyxa miuraensis TaxID=376150 RepID=UPI002B1CC777|nr:NINE protein [Paraliomyxa miuraensis]